ncbi:MAG: DUF815 domain-containing protein, partial [Gammaproteobacteria bacterium]
QDEYLSIVWYWLAELKADASDTESVREHALRWALARGSRSGRSALQFARDWAGRQQLDGEHAGGCGVKASKP